MNIFSRHNLNITIADAFNKKQPVYENEKHILAALVWLSNAQKITRSGGVASWYSLVSGWGYPFIETTGYILGTFLACSNYFNDQKLEKQAIKMADFIVSMQLPSGGYRTYPPSQMKISDPTIFNCGQDILGMIDIYEKTKKKKYLNSAIKAADFVCSQQEKDGSWIRYEYGDTPKVYETRTAWALLRVYQHSKKNIYKKHAIANLNWAKTKQRKNGWFEQANFPRPNPEIPYTHTVSYVTEGFLFSGMILKNKKYISIAEKTAMAVAIYHKKHSFLPGTFDQNWKSADTYSCLTGDAQFAYVFLKLFQLTGKAIFREEASRLILFLKSTQNLSTDNKNIMGGIKGSQPIYGNIRMRQGYCRMSFINWAAKFFIDALLEEVYVNNEGIYKKPN